MSLKNVDLTIDAKTAVGILRKYIGELSEKLKAKGILFELIARKPRLANRTGFLCFGTSKFYDSF